MATEAQREHFDLTAQHLKLLARANVSWWSAEFGAPSIDPKRPYGNGDVVRDMIRILGVEVQVCPHCHEPVGDFDREAMERLHQETQTALAVVLSNLPNIATPGRYATQDYGRTWRRTA